MGMRGAAKHLGDFLTEWVGETVGGLVLGLLACALLGGLVPAAYLAWSFSPRLALAGAGLFGLVLAHGSWSARRTRAKGRRRGFAVVTTAALAVTGTTAAFLLLYATDCGCV